MQTRARVSRVHGGEHVDSKLLYFKLINSLPDRKGSLSATIPSVATCIEGRGI